jgi:hypothetical protein
MNDKAKTEAEERVANAIGQQLEHFRKMAPPCRGMELPDGIILRPTPSRSLYFYLRTWVEGGNIKTQVFASDSPYDRQKANIGAAIMPATNKNQLYVYLYNINELIQGWIEFVRSA